MTADVAAIHFDGVSVWCATRTAVVRESSAVVLSDGVPTFGPAAAALTGDARTETISIADPLLFIDSERVRIGTEECTFAAIVSGVVDRALGAAGVRTKPTLLVMTHPPHWGTPRQHALHAAVRSVASEVVTIDSASVAVHSVMRDVPVRADSAIEFRRRGAVVVDAAPARITACAVETVPVTVSQCRLVGGMFPDSPSSNNTGSGVTASGVTASDESMKSAIDDVRQSISATVAIVHGVGDPALPARVKAASGLTVIELTGSAMASAVLDCVGSTREFVPSDPIGQPVSDPARRRATRGSSAAWLSATPNNRTNDDRTAGERRRSDRASPYSRRSWAALAAAFAVIALAAGVWFAGSAPSTDDAPAVVAAGVDPAAPVSIQQTGIEPSEMPSTDMQSTDVQSTGAAPAPITISAVPRAELTVGRSAMTVPDGWSVDESANRVEMIPDDASPMRIVIVARDLDAGSGTPEVIAALQKQFVTEQSDAVFGDLRTDATVAGRSGLTYLEEPVDGSTVEWSVAVSSGQQVSVGCQSADGARQAISAPCGVVLDSLTIDGV